MKVKDFHIKVCISFIYIMNIFYFNYFIFCQKFKFLVGSYMNFNTWINSCNHHYKNILQKVFVKNYFYNAKKKEVTINPGRVLGFSRPLPRKPPAAEASSESPISSSCSSTSSPQAWKQLTWHTNSSVGERWLGRHTALIFLFSNHKYILMTIKMFRILF